MKAWQLLEFSSTHMAFSLYSVREGWKLESATETKVNLAFQTAIEPAAYVFTASITWLRQVNHKTHIATSVVALKNKMLTLLVPIVEV
jgi:hypothetical protein